MSILQYEGGKAYATHLCALMRDRRLEVDGNSVAIPDGPATLYTVDSQLLLTFGGQPILVRAGQVIAEIIKLEILNEQLRSLFIDGAVTLQEIWGVDDLSIYLKGGRIPSIGWDNTHDCVQVEWTDGTAWLGKPGLDKRIRWIRVTSDCVTVSLKGFPDIEVELT